MRTVKLAHDIAVPVLGQGTWRMGEQPGRRKEETDALRMGVELGMTVIDTAEMYGNGATETFLADALEGLRDRVTLVSKVYPHNAGGVRLERACEDSLTRLKTDYLDLYLLHWRGAVPLAETVAGMTKLAQAGKIRAWGVSNLDLTDLGELADAGGEACATDQGLYNVTRRGPEFDLLPALRARGQSAIAYSPVEQGRLPANGALRHVADRHGVSTYEIALAWTIRNPGVVAIPKAADIAHVRQNRHAADLTLTEEDLSTLDKDFPAPTRKTSLDML